MADGRVDFVPGPEIEVEVGVVLAEMRRGDERAEMGAGTGCLGRESESCSGKE